MSQAEHNADHSDETATDVEPVTARSIALMTNDPERFHVALHGLRRVVRLPDDADGVGVGTSVDTSVLLSRKPTVPQKWSLARMVGPLKGRCTVVQVRKKGDIRPRQASAANLGPFRHRHLTLAHVGGPDTVDAAASNTEFWLSGLPDFLLRSREGKTEGEAFFLALLHAMHEGGCLERDVHGKRLIDVAREVMAKDPLRCPRSFSLATGLEHVTLAHQMQTCVLQMNGLLDDDADDVDPTYTDTSMGRERLRRFRATLVLGGVEPPVERPPALPDGTRAHFHREDVGVCVGRDLEPQVQPIQLGERGARNG